MQPPLLQPKHIKALNRTYDLKQWKVRHHDKHSEIELLRKKNGEWEAIAEVKGADHKTLASYLLFKIEAHDQASAQLDETIYALRLCLESGGLSWEAEQEAEAVLRKHVIHHLTRPSPPK